MHIFRVYPLSYELLPKVDTFRVRPVSYELLPKVDTFRVRAVSYELLPKVDTFRVRPVSYELLPHHCYLLPATRPDIIGMVDWALNTSCSSTCPIFDS